MYTYYDLLYEYLYPFLSLYGNVYLYYSAFHLGIFVKYMLNTNQCILQMFQTESIIRTPLMEICVGH